MPTIRTLARLCGASIGATQMAVVRLEQMGAIRLDRRGRYGTTLRERNVGLLVQVVNRRPLVVALPLPSTLRIQGLATAIKASAAHEGLDLYLVFIRGSRRRLAALVEGQCDVAVMSLLAAHELVTSETKVALELQAGSFVKEHRVFYGSQGPSGSALRVGLDPDSLDFELLTRLEFPADNVEFVTGPYMRAVTLMRQRKLDAVIWDIEEAFVRFPPFVRNRPLSPSVRAAVTDRNTRAAFVVRGQDEAVSSALTSVILVDRVAKVQSRVLSGDQVPEY